MESNEIKKVELANDASSRYARCSHEIDRIKNGIYHNRKGHIPLTEIPIDKDKVRKRVIREGLPEHQAIERINGVPNFQDIFILEKIMTLAKTVCRINIASQFGASGFGTGFLIAPNLLITNNHVLQNPEMARTSFAQFEYQLQEPQKPHPSVSFRLRPDLFFMTSALEKQSDDPHSGLDFTIVAVNETSDEGVRLDTFPYARLDENLGKVLQGENCVVIQHPRGDYKKIVLKDIRMITLVEDFLIYESDTLPGSSGSVVVGLGTGEVVALHHSGVPRRNEDGDWLRKDGTPAQPGDSDDLIDWMGNEGIRVSSIIRAIRNMPLPVKMESSRQQLLQVTSLNTAQPITTPKPETSMTPLPSNDQPMTAIGTTAGMLYFEVELVDDDDFIYDFVDNAARLIPGLKSKERLFPYSTQPEQRNMYYLQVQSAKNPWELAEDIEALPHVLSCTPDLPVATDVGLSRELPTNNLTESAVKDAIYDDGAADWNEPQFKTSWGQSKCYLDAVKLGAEFYRQWNWVAVNWPHQKDALSGWASIKENLKTLKLTQLDTGYSLHSKVKDAYNLTLDMDFIDRDQDAKDEQAKFLLKQPNHGTRTASIIIGGKLAQSSFQNDGNRGLLTENDQSLIKLVPYRIAKSVILIGKGKDMVDAAQHAINNLTDVMFMCMGSYPRPMIEEIARYAYEKGVIWVCAAGNEVEMVVAPALYPGTIAVAAVNPDLEPWTGSSNGNTVDIAAPGESVYVPVMDKDGNEIMSYGNGTSYATPHVSAAAMLWKAKKKDKLVELYTEPWQIVEAFRTNLRDSAGTPAGWKKDKYGAGILNIQKLLEQELPSPGSLKHAYEGKPAKTQWDLGIRETVHFLWNTLKRKTRGGPEESAHDYMPLTERGRTALNILSGKTATSPLEFESTPAGPQKKKILSTYFESYQ
jgi:endonuclease G, mitochondrial